MTNPRILVLCQRGNVRSATTMTVLRDYYMFDDVLCTGIDTTTNNTLYDLYNWCDVVLLAYGQEQYTHFSTPKNVRTIYLADVGDDVYGKAMHPELVKRVISSLERIDFIQGKPTRWPRETYLQLVEAKYKEGHPYA